MWCVVQIVQCVMLKRCAGLRHEVSLLQLLMFVLAVAVQIQFAVAAVII